MTKTFISEYIEEHGVDSVDLMIHAHLDAIQDLNGQNQEKLNYHIAVIRCIIEEAKSACPRIKVHSNQIYHETTTA